MMLSEEQHHPLPSNSHQIHPNSEQRLIEQVQLLRLALYILEQSTKSCDRNASSWFQLVPVAFFHHPIPSSLDALLAEFRRNVWCLHTLLPALCYPLRSGMNPTTRRLPKASISTAKLASEWPDLLMILINSRTTLSFVVLQIKYTCRNTLFLFHRLPLTSKRKKNVTEHRYSCSHEFTTRT